MHYISNTTILSTYWDSVSTSSKERVESSRKHVPQAGNFEFMRIFCKLCCSISFSRMKTFSTILETRIWILQTRFYLTLFHICREKKIFKISFFKFWEGEKGFYFHIFSWEIKTKVRKVQVHRFQIRMVLKIYIDSLLLEFFLLIFLFIEIFTHGFNFDFLFNFLLDF